MESTPAGLHLGTDGFQFRGTREYGNRSFNRLTQPRKLFKFFGAIPSRLIGIEPYVKRGKMNAVDAGATGLKSVWQPASTNPQRP